MKKSCPVLVISSNGVGKLPIKLIATFTSWNEKFSANIWHVKVDPTEGNGLSKASALDALQLRAVAFERFETKLGEVSSSILKELNQAIAIVLDFDLITDHVVG